MKSAEEITDELCDYFCFDKGCEQALEIEVALKSFGDRRFNDGFIDAQLQAHDIYSSEATLARLGALEEAAKVCDELEGSDCSDIPAATIRSLKSKPSGEGGSEMTFTDDDLKRLKESENALARSFGIPALLARLEAAEANVRDCFEFHGIEDRPFYKKWLASKGEGGAGNANKYGDLENKLTIAREYFEMIKAHDHHTYADDLGHVHSAYCDACLAKEALSQIDGEAGV